jgi:hypothetical protein
VFTVTEIFVGLPLAFSRFVMLELMVRNRSGVMVLPGLPPVQVRITFPTSSASPSAWRIGSGLELTLHVGVWAEALNEIKTNSPVTCPH